MLATVQVTWVVQLSAILYPINEKTSLEVHSKPILTADELKEHFLTSRHLLFYAGQVGSRSCTFYRFIKVINK